MDNALIGAGLAFAGGCAIALLNDWLSRMAIKRNPSMLLSLSIFRQAINVAYLVALYFLAKILPWDMLPLLVGGALGITIPSIFLTRRLVKLNDARKEQLDARDEDGSNGGENNG